MTTTPAMPEHSVAIKQLTMAANQFDCAAATTNDHKKAAEYLRESREIRASIATLQAQPAEVSDDEREAFEAWATSCWHDTSKYQGIYKSVQTHALWCAWETRAILALRQQSESERDLRTRHTNLLLDLHRLAEGEATLCDFDEVKRLEDKIDALVDQIASLRPQAVPMTEADTARLDWIASNFEDVLLLEILKDLPSDSMSFRQAIDHLRGITAPAGGEGK